MSEKPRVLCVDDQEGVVAGMRVTLRKEFEVVTATSGREALDALASQSKFALLITDMRMPEMTGVELMRSAYEIAPTTQRILLTGFADTESAMQAVNLGHVFRYLTKPCSPPELRDVCSQALAEHLAQEAAIRLEQDAALGWSYAYGNLLLLSRPMAYGRTLRLVQIAGHFGGILEFEDLWRLELGALMVYVGYCGLSTALLEQLYRHENLQPDDVEKLAIAFDEALLPFQHLPGVTGLTDAVLVAWTSTKHAVRASTPINLLHEILAISLNFVEQEHEKGTSTLAFDALPGLVVGQRLKDAVAKLREFEAPPIASSSTLAIRPEALWPGMVLSQNLRTTRDILLLPAGHEVTPSAVKRIQELPREQLPGDISIYRLARRVS